MSRSMNTARYPVRQSVDGVFEHALELSRIRQIFSQLENCDRSSNAARIVAARALHDGSAPDLLTVVNHYDQLSGLHLTPEQKADLVEYLKSL